jgi:hypothetical protein
MLMSPKSCSMGSEQLSIAWESGPNLTFLKSLVSSSGDSITSPPESDNKAPILFPE